MREVLLDGNIHEPNGAFVIVESTHNKLTAEGAGFEFEQITLYYRSDVDASWVEHITWVDAEWRGAGNEAFEAIIGVIAKIVAGEVVTRP